ncbi:transient receptor potential cation channel subfamily M member-like 2 isoform X2 [Mya arenaria]|uniref:transient receptor potential cation channel subfamily M member-like 2 isoform X2 n=1 Tax=Mya arenaria TaxID=6604 RepID=UPI0022E7238F|nr:transient receptor potential cation channel subfamily M member-like 2 isoform X2 [Mya arenaria]
MTRFSHLQDRVISRGFVFGNSDDFNDFRFTHDILYLKQTSHYSLQEPRSPEEDNEKEWIQKNIKMRECSHFITDPKKEQDTELDNPLCYCNYRYNQHSIDAQKQKKQTDEMTKWDNGKHTKSVITNAFGNIKFDDCGGIERKYVRVDVDTKMSHMLELMTKFWGMGKPNLLISVTGGAKNFNMSKRLRDTFRLGLMKTVLSTGAWIVTSGTHAGVVKLIGEAVKDSGIASKNKNQVISIGIAPWGCVQNKEALIDEESCGKWPAKYRTEKKQRINESFLDPNHSHFILVDDGTQHQFDIEIPFRAKLKKEIASIKTETKEDAKPMPNILLVLGGGPGTLKNVYQAILNNTPIVVVNGSGRAADILAYAYLNRKEVGNETKDHVGEEHTTMFPYVEDKVKEMIKREFGNDETTETHLKRICECLNKSDLISVYEIEGKGGVKDIDVAILQALLKANKYKLMDLLKLALAWNRIDVAKSDIFRDDMKWPTLDDSDDVIFSAILLNRVDLIKLFLDHSENLNELLTKDKLRMLFNKIPTNCLLRTSLGSSDNDEDSLNDVGTLIRTLIGDNFHIDELDNDNTTAMKNTNKENVEKTSLNKPFQLLFIWSILMIYQDMAKLFWAEGKGAIAAALVGSSLLKSMLRKNHDAELGHKIKECMKEWSELAVGVLSECHLTDEHKAQDLVERKLSKWGDTSCMLIAVKAYNKDFISQTPCQSLLNRILYGRLVQNNSLWRLLLCLFFPPLICVLPDFTKPDTCSPCVHPPASTTGDDSNKDSNQESHNSQDSVNNKRKSSEESKMKAKDKFYYFFKAPVISFMYNVCSHLVFLSLYTYILVFTFNTQVSVEEIILIIWVFSFTMEEIRQMVTSSSTTLATKLQSYFTDTWNVVDTMTNMLFIIGITLRFLPYEGTFEAARVVLALNFITFFLRLLYIFSVHKELGPKLVMIGKMMKDLIYFFLILMVFVLSYAIAAHSILYPNAPLTWKTAVQIIRKSYWNIYGELFLEEIEGEADCSYDAILWINGTQARCPTDTGKLVVPIMMGIYMLLANVLLLNLLIAMFSNTFQKVQDNADKHWVFMRFSLIHEYYTRPVLFPPLILLAHIVLVFRFVCESCCGKAMKKNIEETDKFLCRKLKNDLELTQWEKLIADAYQQKDVQSLEHKVDSTHDMLAKMKTQKHVHESDILGSFSELGRMYHCHQCIVSL